MSLNQSRVEKSDAHIRKPGRSSGPGQQRSYHNVNSGKGGASGAGSSLPPSPSLNSQLPSANTDRSLRKTDGQGGQPRVANVALSPEVHISRGVQNGALPQNQQAVALLPGGPGVVKQSDHSTHKVAQTLPRQTSAAARPPVSASNSAPSGDSSKSFSFQFGTISPGFMNGVQIPARTSSAPPSLDEQKRDQALHDTRHVPVSPIVAPKQPLKQSQQPLHPPLPQQQHQQFKKDSGVKIANVVEDHPSSKTRRDASVLQIPVPPQSNAAKPSVHPLVGGSMSASFRQPQPPLPFNNPNTQPAQNVSAGSIQMPLSLSGASVQPPVYVPNLQSHPLQAQGMIHQSQGLGYAPSMNPQLGPQLGSLGISIAPQFPQPPINKFGGQRKAVKITDPKTHEELKLDKRADSLETSFSGQGPQLARSQASVPPHSQQPINSFPSTHQISYYSPMQPNTYTPVYYAGQAPHPLPSAQIAAPGSSVPRHNYTVHHGGPTVSLATHSVQSASLPLTNSGAVIQVTTEPVNLEAVTGQLASIQVTVKPPTSSIPAKVGGSTISVESSSFNKGVIQSERGKPPKHQDESGSAHLQRHTDGARLISSAMGEILAQLPPPTISSAVAGDVGPDSHTQQLKHDSGTASFSNSLHAMVKNSVACSVSAEQRQASNIPSTDVILSEHPVAGVEGGQKWDPLKKLDSMKDRQKHSLKEQKQFEVANQVGNSGGILKSSISVMENTGKKSGPGSEVQESRQVVSEVSSPVLPLPSSLKLDIVLPEVAVSETKDGKTISTSVSNSDRVMEGVICSSKAFEAVSSIASDALPVTVSLGERDPRELSISVNPEDMKELISESLVSSDRAADEDCIPHDAGIATGLSTTRLEGDKRKMNCFSKSENQESKVTSAGVADNSKIIDVIPHEVPVVNRAYEKVTAVLPKRLESEISAGENTASTFIAHSVENLGTDVDKREASVDSSISQRCSNCIEPDKLSSGPSLGNDYEKKIQHESKVSGEKDIPSDQANSNKGVPSVPLSVSSEVAQKHETKVTESGSSGLTSNTMLSPKDRTMSEHVKAKIVSGKKKTKKELLSKADAAGTTSDLYMAYKTSEQKREFDISENVDSPSSSIHDKQIPAGETENHSTAKEDSQSRSELDDWEEAAEIPSPRLKSLDRNEYTHRKKSIEDIDVGSGGKKRYTRDFLMTFQDNCKDLPIGFEIGVDISDLVMSAQVNASLSVDRGGGRIYDRQPSGSPRLDRRGGGNTEDDRWNKMATSFISPRGDLAYGVGMGGSRPGQGGNSGVLKNPRGQTSGQYVGGILSGPMPSPGGSSRNMDGDRWQRAVPVQKGLIPSPHTQTVVMHKAENKYEVGKVSGEEERKQRQLKAILNKLTPQNFEKLFQQVKEVNIDNVVTLTGVISQIFDKALMEPTFCEMYADFCSRLAGALPDLVEDNKKITFRRLLLNKCQEEFERGEREEAEADNVVEGGEVKQSDGEREAKRIKARRRMLGNIRLIGELYKKKMLTERIMHECIKKLLGQVENPDEEDVESLCKLMSTIGVIIDHPVAKVYMDAYFDRIEMLSVNQKLSSRVRFMLRDTIDLRKNNWQQRRKVEGPKKIEDVHRDAAQERHSQAGRVPRSSGMSSSSRRGQTIDYGPRGSSAIPSVGQQTGSLRGMPTSGRFATQDVRMEDRHILENRAFSIPLPPRTSDDDSITLGPQGGLGKVMSMQGQPSPPGGFNNDVIGTGDFRRMPSGLNGSNANSGADWALNRPRDVSSSGLLPDRPMSAPSSDQSNHQDLSSRDAISSRGSLPGANSTRDKLSEDNLTQKSMSTIKEFYSANDEEEVASCMKDLNAPAFYPTMVSLWVTDSFERKAGERDRLTKLLIFLCKSRSGLLNQMQLITGLESVFASLLDTIYDAPKSAEFLGGILGQVILENIITLREVARLICDGGEEPGSLTEAGIASDVLGSIFEVIKKEKGETVLNEIRKNSNFRLEDFLPPDPKRQGKLVSFA